MAAAAAVPTPTGDLVAHANALLLTEKNFEDERLRDQYRYRTLTRREIDEHGTRCGVEGVYYLKTRPKLFCEKGWSGFECYTSTYEQGVCGIDVSGEVHGLWIEKAEYALWFRDHYYEEHKWETKPELVPLSVDWWLDARYGHNANENFKIVINTTAPIVVIPPP
jgi:hypothetical protein